jgi:hypothetical protein
MNVDSIRYTPAQFPQVNGAKQQPALRDKPEQMEPESSTMSKYLSTEEKDLLGVLFPPSGRDFGIGQYRKVQTPPQTGKALGQKIDITT